LPVTGVNPLVDEQEFARVLAPRTGPLLELAARLDLAAGEGLAPALPLLTRPWVAILLSQAVQVEELLDAYGASNNERWHALRSVTAALKLFARVHYSLLHVKHAAPWYQLQPIPGDIAGALAHATDFTTQVLVAASRRLLAHARKLGLPARPVEVCDEVLPAGRLPHDRALRQVDSAPETIARLTTAFLNLAESATALEGTTAGPDAPLPGEAELRQLTEEFHNLQALYDTHVSNTNVERADPDLRSLRGHASMVYHLLDIATDLAHYYERHVAAAVLGGDPAHLMAVGPDCVGTECLRRALREFAIGYAARYLRAGRGLAQALLRRYAEPGEIAVPVPPYRGFHVRPSTLVAKIVLHYGSPVTMSLEDETYDAATPIELFRANEKINALKRRWLAAEIARILPPAAATSAPDLVREVRHVLLTLAEQSKILIYEQPLPVAESFPGDPAAAELALVVGEVTRLQALGKIDIHTELRATFRGDRRVLADIQALAEHGYGEDAYGNNIALPKQLSYLRR
jgi:hypothetical protein